MYEYFLSTMAVGLKWQSAYTIYRPPTPTRPEHFSKSPDVFGGIFGWQPIYLRTTLDGLSVKMTKKDEAENPSRKKSGPGKEKRASFVVAEPPKKGDNRWSNEILQLQNVGYFGTFWRGLALMTSAKVSDFMFWPPCNCHTHATY